MIIGVQRSIVNKRNQLVILAWPSQACWPVILELARNALLIVSQSLLLSNLGKIYALKMMGSVFLFGKEVFRMRRLMFLRQVIQAKTRLKVNLKHITIVVKVTVTKKGYFPICAAFLTRHSFIRNFTTDSYQVS